MTWLDLPADHPYGIHNLPYGVFSTPGNDPRVGVRVGDQVLDVAACARVLAETGADCVGGAWRPAGGGAIAAAFRSRFALAVRSPTAPGVHSSTSSSPYSVFEIAAIHGSVCSKNGATRRWISS